jgi:hypothetical protein
LYLIQGPAFNACTEKRARLLLERGRAEVVKVQLFTIRLKDRLVADSELQPLELKFDPGSSVTGAALVGTIVRGSRLDQANPYDYQPRPKKLSTDQGHGSPTSPEAISCVPRQPPWFQTVDLVKAVVPTGKYAGTHVGRVAVRSSGSFDIQTKDGKKRVFT